MKKVAALLSPWQNGSVASHSSRESSVETVNPYQSPEEESQLAIVEEDWSDRAKLRELAVMHRRAIFWLFVAQGVFLIVGAMIGLGVDEERHRWLTIPVIVIAMIVAILTGIAAILLAFAFPLGGVCRFVVCLSWMSYFSVFLPFFATYHAAEFLREHGVEVGFFGADLAQFDEPLEAKLQEPPPA